MLYAISINTLVAWVYIHIHVVYSCEYFLASRTFEGHEASVVCCAYTPNGGFLISGSTNGDLCIWDAVYGHNRYLLIELEAHDLGVTCCQFSPVYGSAGRVTPG